MEEKIVKTARNLVKYAEAYIISADIPETRVRRLWESADDEIQGMITLSMELLDCEIDDYPITKLLEIQQEIRNKM